MSGATAAASASQQAAPTAAEARSELEEALWGRINTEQIVKMHRDFPQYAEYIEEWTFNQEAWMWQQKDKANLAETLGCSEDELRRTYSEQRRKWFARRAQNIGKNRTEKHDLAYAAALWKIHSVSALHKKLASISETEKELAALKEAKADTLAVMEMHKQLMEEKGKMAAEYKAKVEAAVEAKVQPEIERQMEEKKVILDSKIAHHVKMAEWAIEGQAKNKAKQAAWEDAHQGELDLQKRKIEDQARELKRLRQVVAGYEAHQQHQKKRKQDAENQRQRRRLHAQHPAVPTMTPESTTKKTKPRTSRRSALACIGNNTTIV